MRRINTKIAPSSYYEKTRENSSAPDFIGLEGRSLCDAVGAKMQQNLLTRLHRWMPCATCREYEWCVDRTDNRARDDQYHRQGQNSRKAATALNGRDQLATPKCPVHERCDCAANHSRPSVR